MTSASSGAHVKIGSYEFVLAEEQDGHYVFEDASGSLPQEIVGDRTKLDIDAEERLLWRLTDWSGGEGSRFWNPESPGDYSYSEVGSTAFVTSGSAVNPRLEGQVTGKPERYRTTLTVTNDAKRVFMASGDGEAWIGCSRELFHGGNGSASVASTNATDATDYFTGGTAWNAVTTGVTDDCSAMGDGENQVYVAFGSGTNRELKHYNNGETATVVVTSHASSTPWRGRLVTYNGRLYGWTGRKLHEFDIGEGLPLTLNATPGYRVRHDIGANGTTNATYELNTTNGWWADIASSESAVYYLVGQRAVSKVYQYDVKKGARHIWTLPTGFTGKSLSVAGGVLFVGGHWGGEATTASPGGALYALPLTTRQPTFVKFIREHTAQRLHIQEMAASYGNSIMLGACNTGRVFVYDMDKNGLSMLDILPWTVSGSGGGVDDGDKKIGSLLTFGEFRAAAVHRPRDATPGTTIEVFAWKDDAEANRATANTNHSQAPILYSGRYDFKMPYETKFLYGFHVAYRPEDTTTSGLLAGQQIDVDYRFDNTTAWTAGGTITSATTPSSAVKGRHFIQISSVSSTKKFQNMEIRLTLTGSRVSAVNYQPPILLDLTTEARTLDSDKTWTLLLRMKDDMNNARQSDHRFASTARTYLRALRSNQALVTLLDYYRYQTNHGSPPNTSSSHTVLVHKIKDVIMRNGEGIIEVVLKEVKT